MSKALVAVLSFAVFFITFVVLIHEYPSRLHPRGERDDASGAMEALDFWTRSRAYPAKDIPSEKYFKAYQYSKQQLKKNPPTPQSNPWQFIGPINLSGRMISVVCNPQNGSTVYTGSASGGLWRSYTGGLGSDWERVTLGFPALGISAIAIDPTDSNTIYLGTGEVYRYQGTFGGLVVRTTRGSYGIGILKTTDGGATWTKSLDWTMNEERGIQTLKINPLNPNTVWAATTDGIYKSTDAGSTWSNVLFLLMGEDILIDPTDTNRVMVSYGNLAVQAGIFRTDDDGANWNPLPLPTYSGKILLEMYAAHPNVVYASAADSTTGVTGLWRSTDFGTNWTLLNSDGIAGVQGWYSHFVAVHPTDSTQVVHAGVNIYKSTNGGVSFFVSSGSYSDHHQYAHDPSDANILYVANDDGIYRSTNFGGSFTNVSLGLATGQFYSGFSNSTSDSLLAIVQAQDHIPGYIYQGSLFWSFSARDEAGWTAINPTNDTIMYAINRNGGVVYKSINRGVSFPTGVGLSTFGAWNSPIVIAPSSTNILYAGKQKIFKSTDGGSSFVATNSNLNLDGNPALAMAISSTNPDTVYVGTAPYATSAHLWRTTNGGGAWTNVTGILPDRYPMDLAVDPNDSRIVYAAYGGYGVGHVFKSTDAGTTWTDITGTLPDVHATAVVVDPLNSNHVYVGNDITVYVSTDAGLSWIPYSEALPDAILVSDLTISPSNQMLRVGTHGNGAYERKLLPPALATVSTSHSSGWNLISVPLDVLNDSLSSLYPSVLGGVVYEYNLAYTPRKTMSNGTGYWAKFLSAGLQTITGLPLPSVSVAVNAGWNLIGSVDHSIPVPSGGIISGDVFSYSGGYYIASSIDPGKAYWVKASTSGVIALGPRAVPKPGADHLSEFSSFTISDNLGRSQTLYLADNSNGSLLLDRYALPPLPPEGLFDARFASGRMVEAFSQATQQGGGRHPIQMQSPAYPLTISYIIKSTAIHEIILEEIKGGTANSFHELIGQGQLTIERGDEHTLSLRVTATKTVPTQFTLYQNYPNPFNPSTTIAFDVPEKSLVRVKIYDILGREIKTLVDREYEAGSYSLRADFADWASGIYLYRLQAEYFTDMKKLVHIK